VTFATGFASVFTSVCVLTPAFAFSCSVVTHPDNINARAAAQTHSRVFIPTFPLRQLFMAILTIGKGGAECRKSARLGPRGEVSGISRAALPSIEAPGVALRTPDRRLPGAFTRSGCG
jgi:hypothetical protein